MQPLSFEARERKSLAVGPNCIQKSYRTVKQSPKVFTQLHIEIISQQLKEDHDCVQYLTTKNYGLRRRNTIHEHHNGLCKDAIFSIVGQGIFILRKVK